MSEEKLSVRLEAHANAHALVSPYDDEQAQWEADLRKAVEIVRRVEEASVGDIWQHAYIDGQHTSRIRITRQPGDGLEVIGQRVRLVRDE